MDTYFQIEFRGLKDLLPKESKAVLHFQVTLLDEAGRKIGSEIKTAAFKEAALSDNPVKLNFNISDKFAGLGVQLLSKGFFRESTIGQLTIKFNTNLLNGLQVVDEWFKLTRKSKPTVDPVQVSLKIASLTALTNALPASSSSSSSSTGPEESNEPSSTASTAAPAKGLKLSSKWSTKDNDLKSSAYVVVEEDLASSSSEDEVAQKPTSGDPSSTVLAQPTLEEPKSGGEND